MNEPGYKLRREALLSLNEMPPQAQGAVFAKLSELLGSGLGFAENPEAHLISTDEPLYLIRVGDDIRVSLLVRTGEPIEVVSTQWYGPELMAWAREQLDEQEIVAAMREVEETGGFALEDFIGELEERALYG
jgi:hypothetical protein